jgi:hypothetical protein
MILNEGECAGETRGIYPALTCRPGSTLSH